MNGYPDGCTQHTHDAAFNRAPDAETMNAIVREVESRAEEEVRTAATLFCDWLFDNAGPLQLARLVSFYKGGKPTECRKIVDDVVQRYQQYRVATLDAAEQREIEGEL